MAFYRKATAEDFKSFEVEFSNYRYMGDEEKLLIEKGEIRRAQRALQVKYGFGLTEAKKYCLKYLAFVNAKNDFKQGKTVYTEY